MPSSSSNSKLTIAGLFAGIGGIELGFHRAGYQTQLLCELEPGAKRVLETRFKLRVEPDVRRLSALPKVDVVAAGFPCQDLSQAGKTAGIRGNQSSLVGEIFKRLRNLDASPRWLLLENVPFMLQLQRGKAMRYLVDELERLGFTWAYRVVDARAFGIPQRRLRVLLLASRTEDPRPILFDGNAEEFSPMFSGSELCGFYWTEGSRGLGWAVDAVPTLKGGSTIGIPSPPAIWDPQDGSISTPDIRDAERLQGFDADWTVPALDAQGVRKGHRWKLVGNAVNVSVAEWIANRLVTNEGEFPSGEPLKPSSSWPIAAWGTKGKAFKVEVSKWPVKRSARSLRKFLEYPVIPLSYRAAAGFLSRALVSGLWFEEGFLEDVKRHVDRRSMSAA